MFEDRIFVRPNAPGTETLGFDLMDLNEQGKWRPSGGSALLQLINRHPR